MSRFSLAAEFTWSDPAAERAWWDYAQATVTRCRKCKMTPFISLDNSASEQRL
jgi:hypothetical protein